MNFVKNKTLYVYNNDGLAVPFYTVSNEVFLTADLIEGLFSFSDYRDAVRSRLSKIVVRVYKLNSDETISGDISEYVASLSLSFKYQQGQTRMGNLSLMNHNGEFMLSPVRNTLWKGSKLRIDVGLAYKNNIFWKQCGIFVCGTFSIDEANRQISFPIYDKFALLDGTVGGKVDSELQIPRGTPIRYAIQLCLGDDKGNGESYDYKPVIFPSEYEGVTTPYNISKTPETTIGELLLELSDIISCDIFYNDTGNLVLEAGSDTNLYIYKATLWELSDDDVFDYPTQEVDFSKAINRVYVVGSIENGYQHKAKLDNTNAESQNNVHMTDVNSLYIEDTNLISDELCMDRAKYEMKKQGILTKKINIKTTFIPNLLPNNVVSYTNKRFGIKNERYIMSSIDFDLTDSKCIMSVSMSNLKEVIFA